MKKREKITDARIDAEANPRGIFRTTSYNGISQDKVLWRCNRGHEWSASTMTILRGHGCKKCTTRITDFELDVKLATLGIERISENIGNSRAKLKFRCKNGHEWSAIKQAVYSGRAGCKQCNKLSEESITKRLIDRGITLVSKYVALDSKITVCCENGHEWSPIAKDILYKKSGCSKCISKASKLSNGDIDSRLNGRTLKRTEDWAEQDDGKLGFICGEGHTFRAIPTNVLNNETGCPHCKPKISSQETLLISILNGEEYAQSNRDVISPLEIDIYLPNRALAIEVNGRRWHSETFGKDVGYHIGKTKQCAAKGVTLLHFWDDEVDKKFDIVSSMILSRLGKTTKLSARKLEVRKVGNTEAKLFLNSNHLQGDAKASVKIGLFDDKELVQIMTFSKPRFGTDADWEIVRIASKLDHTVIGGASKMLSNFIAQYDPVSIVSYADLRYSVGAVYKVLGFELSHNSKPNYFYTRSTKNVSRYQAQKHKLSKLLGDKFNSEKSETENMLAAGYNKVYDCGNAVYIWRKP